MTKPKDPIGGFDATDCSVAIKVLQLLRNTIEKEAGTAMARADSMEGVIRSQWIMKFNALGEVMNLIDMTIKSIPTESPYENCKTFGGEVIVDSVTCRACLRQSNAGVPRDNEDGPCACGAWH